MGDTIALYHDFLRLTGDATAASNLVLAHMKGGDTDKDRLLTLRQAAAILGYAENGLRKIVARSKRARSGYRINAPTIEFAQAGLRGAIRFRREWLDAFIDGQQVAAPLPVKKAKSGD